MLTLVAGSLPKRVDVDQQQCCPHLLAACSLVAQDVLEVPADYP